MVFISAKILKVKPSVPRNVQKLPIWATQFWFLPNYC